MSANTATLSAADKAAELLSEGRRLMGLKRSHEAIPLFNEAYALAPENPDIRFQLGSVARLQGDLPLALQHMSFCLERTPERPEVWLRLGEILSCSRRYDEGVAIMKSAVDRHPDHGRIWWRYGRLLRYTGALDDAHEVLMRASSAPSVRDLARFDIAPVFEALGDQKRAARLLKAVAETAQDRLLQLSAGARLATMYDDEPDPETSRRVAFHIKSPFHETVLGPGFEAARAHHHTLLTHDVEEVLAHRPDAIVGCDSQLVSMRRLAPEAVYINTRHGLISKHHAAIQARSADYFCVTNDEQAAWFRDRDMVPGKEFWPIGYLQLDPLFRGEVEPAPIGAPAGMPVALYAPTHGETISSVPMLGDDPVRTMRPLESDVFLVIKPHPEIPTRHPEWMDRFRVAAALHENVMLVTDAQAPIDRYMAAADVMISDCSSVMLQYLALDRPLVLISNPARFSDK